MADDAPASAGTDETAGHNSAHSSNGNVVDAKASLTAHGDSLPSGRGPVVENGAVENGAAVMDEIDHAATTALPNTSTGDPLPPDLGSAPDAGTGVGPDAVDAGSGSEPTAGPAVSSDAGSATGPEVPAASARAGKQRSFWRELPVLVVVAVALAVLIRTFLVQAFFIPSGSMETTLHGCPGCSGDRVLVNKLVYDVHDPRPGDVVVFRGPPSWDAEVPTTEPGNVVARAIRWVGQTVGVAQPDEKDFVKRVIAVGGQTVACCDPQGRVTVNGVPLDEPYIYLSISDAQSQPFGPVTVPEGRLWVMGDHRDGSADSRAHLDDGTSGTVPVSDVIGKAFVIVWPPSRWNTLGTPSTFHGLSSGPLSVGAPMALGVIGTLPVAAFRRRRRRRRGPGD